MNDQRTIFLVDDEPVVLRALSRVLRAGGYRTQTFNSGQEFIETYQSDLAGCLISDLCMPGMSGTDIQQWVARLRDPLPIIFLTGEADAQDKEHALMRGAIDVLTKPVSARVLFGSIERAFAINQSVGSKRLAPVGEQARD